MYRPLLSQLDRSPADRREHALTQARHRFSPFFESPDVGDEPILDGEGLPAFRRLASSGRRAIADHVQTHVDRVAVHARLGDIRAGPVSSTTAVPGEHLVAIATAGGRIVRRSPGDIEIEELPIAVEVGRLERGADPSGDLLHGRRVSRHRDHLPVCVGAILAPERVLGHGHAGAPNRWENADEGPMGRQSGTSTCVGGRLFGPTAARATDR